MAGLPDSQVPHGNLGALCKALLTLLGFLLPMGVSTAVLAEERPAVVELFTSQGCYSCPPAEAFLGELVERDDLIALEFHVDYWDDLVYGSAGRWKDVFSSPRYTRRQQDYARRMASTRVYTPQMVVNGREAVVGSRRGDVFEAIENTQGQGRNSASLVLSKAEGESFSLMLDGETTGPAELWLVAFDRAHVTQVRAGENKGKTLANHHVVTEITQLARWEGGPLQLDIESPADGANRGCAILVQEERQGPILAASYCP